MKRPILLSFLTLALLFSCDPNGNEQVSDNKSQVDSTKEEQIAEPKQNEDSEGQPHHFICYASSINANLGLSISFDENEKALKAKYKGQKESMTLTFIKENVTAEGAYPMIETYYSEIYNGKENGIYKLTHSGSWDFAEYTRSRDGKKFKFTINHDLSIGNDGYRTTPCF